MLNETFFNEFTIRLNRPASQVIDDLADKGVLGGIPVSRLYDDPDELQNLALVAATECTTEDDMDALVAGLREVL